MGPWPRIHRTFLQVQFALNTLRRFERNGHQPVYPSSYTLPPPTPDQLRRAAHYQNLPPKAVEFFNQLGKAVSKNPIPDRDTALSGTALSRLPAWVVPQHGAKAIYRVPSYGQQAVFDTFAPIGLTEHGFRIPADWGKEQLQALQEGYETGQERVNDFFAKATSDPSTNYWGIVNDLVGTYPNTRLGYLYRSLVVVAGGVANIPVDGIYPTLTGNPMPFDGNNTYKLTFTPAASAAIPATGIYPPIVNDAGGNPLGFWSVTLYATDPTEAAAPFIVQSSVLNTSYSSADTAVISVDQAANSMTVSAPAWGTLAASTPILFGGDVASYGLTAGTVYYVAGTPVSNADHTTYSFQISQRWLQELSPGLVPIQNSGGPGPLVSLQSSTGAGALTYGMVKPVSQLGSAQLAANQLAKNADGSVTVWFAPALPAGAPAANWIPTPSSAYYNSLYSGVAVPTAFEIMLRMYYPTPGNEPPSILPCNNACKPPLHQSYIPPALELVQ